MTRSTYGRDDFEGLRLFILIFCFSISVFFTAIHTVQRLFYTPPILTANSRLLKNSILSANWLIIVMYIPFLITYTVVSIDDDVHICRGIHIWGLVSYTVINFCFYRVLLYRSQAYDVMKEYEKTYFYVYWGVHIVCPGLVASVAFVAGIGNYEIRTENIRGGNRLCVIDGFHFIPYISGSVPALMLAFADLGISLGCLSLLVLPLLKPGFTHRGETGVVRNVIFSSIAIISTFTTLVIMAIFEFNDGYWTVGLVMEIGALDLIINIICINLCWPAMFYLKTIKRLCFSALGIDPGSINSSHPKKTSSSGPKSKDYIKRARISTKQSDYKPGPNQGSADHSAHEANIGAFSPKVNPDIMPLDRPSRGSRSKAKVKTLVCAEERLSTPKAYVSHGVSPSSGHG